jgi:D-alanine-D-alanine ligase
VRIGVLYDGYAAGWSDEDIRRVLDSVQSIVDVLGTAGHEVTQIAVRPGLQWVSSCQDSDLVFNLCEGIGAVSRFESMVVGTLELTEVPFTGARMRSILLCHNKALANAWLEARGLPVPQWHASESGRVPSGFPLPALVKPAAEDASVGIDQGAVVTSRETLEARVLAATEQHGDVLVQRYVPGREFAVAFVGGEVLPVSEIDFSAMPDSAWPIVSFQAKWVAGSPEDAGTQPVCPADVSTELAERLRDIASRAWLAVGGTGYGRVDLRVDDVGQPWVIEVNPNPDLSEDAGLARMGRAAGWSYSTLVLRIVQEALEAAEREIPQASAAPGVSSRAEARASLGSRQPA